MLWAHSRNERGQRHPLDDHLPGTAALAAEFATPFGAAGLAGYLALTHDVGKAGCFWQEGLLVAERTGGPVGVDHKTAGSWLASRHVGAFALAVHGHHGGIPSSAWLQQFLRGLHLDQRAQIAEAIDRAATVVPEILQPPTEWCPAWYDRARRQDPTVPDMLLRLVASALFDADFLDTERHFDGDDASARSNTHSPSMAELAARFEAACSGYLARRDPAPVDELRQELADHAMDVAAGPVGVYRLAAPTGSGKTIAAGRFALHHASQHGLRRVVIAVPYITITEQNAAVYRELLERPTDSPDPVVLEHHSSIDLRLRAAELARRQRLAAENWDAPFVVTTTVQLFHSLFGNRPGAMRKLHRLARSVLVLDEVQALPDRLLVPILSALRCLSDWFGTTVLLASATQPEFWALSPFRGLACRDVVPEQHHRRLSSAFRRVRYQWRFDPKPTLAAIAEEAASLHQVLVVVNTTADAAKVHAHLQATRPAKLGPTLHLSTRMAPQHRHDVLKQIQDLLEADRPVAVVATPLVEAGVDLSFPVVYRAFAPADSLQQAAGRANRNGTLPDGGLVVIFDPVDGGQPTDQAYKTALASTQAHFGPRASGTVDPDDQAALAAYYRDRYSLQGIDGRGDGVRVQQLRQRLDFPGVALRFDFFAEATRQVFAPYGDHQAVRPTVERLRAGEPVSRADLRALQPFLATLSSGLAEDAVAVGAAVEIAGDLLDWQGAYHPDRGLVLPDPASRPPKTQGL